MLLCFSCICSKIVNHSQLIELLKHHNMYFLVFQMSKVVSIAKNQVNLEPFKNAKIHIMMLFILDLVVGYN